MKTYTSNIQVMPGVSGIKEAYERTLQAKTVDIVCLSHNYEEVVGDYFDKTYGPKLYGGKIVTREILPDTKENRAYAEKKDRTKNLAKFLQNPKATESDFMLEGNRATFISYEKSDPYALVIEDKALVTNLQNQFEALWRGL